MEVMKTEKVAAIKVESAQYKGQALPVKGVTVRWLSKEGADEAGQPEYGLRYFSVEPGGEIPIHSHHYMQTMYILSGQFECYKYDPETDEVAEAVVCGPGDGVYVPSMEPHGMRNISDTDKADFLCCICCLYE